MTGPQHKFSQSYLCSSQYFDSLLCCSVKLKPVSGMNTELAPCNFDWDHSFQSTLPLFLFYECYECFMWMLWWLIPFVVDFSDVTIVSFSTYFRACRLYYVNLIPNLKQLTPTLIIAAIKVEYKVESTVKLSWGIVGLYYRNHWRNVFDSLPTN